MTLDKRIRFLFQAHCVVTVVLLAAAYASIPASGYLLSIVISSQVCLFGIWAGLGTSSWRRRLGAIIVGIAFVAVLRTLRISTNIPFAFSGDLVLQMLMILAELAFMVSFSLLAVTIAIVLIQRFWRIRFHRFPSQAPSPTSECLQFSILHLMLLTVAVAVVVVIGKYLRLAMGGDVRTIVNNSRLLILFGMTNIAMAVVYPVSISLMALWATLAVGRPAPRIGIVIFLSLAIGLISPFYFSRPWSSFVILPLFVVAEVLVVIASLYVLRSCGYRLVRAWEEGEVVAGPLTE